MDLKIDEHDKEFIQRRLQSLQQIEHNRKLELEEKQKLALQDKQIIRQYKVEKKIDVIEEKRKAVEDAAAKELAAKLTSVITKKYAEKVKTEHKPKVSEKKKEELIRELKNPTTTFGKSLSHADPTVNSALVNSAGIPTSKLYQNQTKPFGADQDKHESEPSPVRKKPEVKVSAPSPSKYGKYVPKQPLPPKPEPPAQSKTGAKQQKAAQKPKSNPFFEQDDNDNKKSPEVEKKLLNTEKRQDSTKKSSALKRKQTVIVPESSKNPFFHDDDEDEFYHNK